MNFPVLPPIFSMMNRIGKRWAARFLTTLFILVLFVLASCDRPRNKTLQDPPLKGIGIYSDNSFYWQYDQKPVMLIGGSAEDNLFQIKNPEQHLDLLRSVGGNYVRCTMSSRDSGNFKPYYQENELYDLDHWNPEYWHRFEAFLQLTKERDIVVQVELWATYDFYHGARSWAQNVFNPKNNSTYNAKESGLPEVIEHSAQMKVNPFFASVPGLENNKLVLKQQQRFIDKILSYTLNHDHILYCIDNETNTKPEWGEYWAKYLRKKATSAGRIIYITEMWDNWDPTGGVVEGVERQKDETHPFLERSSLSNTLNKTEIYDFVDISNNNAQDGEVHYRSALFVRERIRKSGMIRPINNVKVYGGTIYEAWTKAWAGSFKDGEERFWRNLFAGHASIRFHRPPSGIGLNPVAQQHIKSMRMLTDSLDLFRHVPFTSLLSAREPNEAFCLAIPGEEYALYFPAAGEVEIDIAAGPYVLRWLHIRSSVWRNAKTTENLQTISTPDNDQWVVWIRRRRG